jgi:N-acetylmuramoyl-L-alanine amidase
MNVVPILLAALVVAAGNTKLTVLGPGSRREVVQTAVEQGAEYVPVRVLSKLLEGRQAWQAELRRMTLEFDGGPLVLVAGSPFVVAGNTVLQMRHPAVLRSGELWVPLGLFQEPLAGLTPYGFRWLEAERLVTRRDPLCVLASVGLEGWGDTLMVRVTFTGKPEFSVARRGDRLVLDVAGASLGDEVPRWLGGGGPVERIGVVEQPAGVLIEAFLGREAEVLLEEGMEHAELKLWAKGSPGPRTYPRSRDAITVVVDPGHGGRDPGATGRGGLREKWVTLKVARLLQEELHKRMSSVRVVFTRKGDIMVPLRERAEMANRERGDIFVSLHANFSYNREAHGMETYFLSVAKTDEERAVAAMENAPLSMEASWEGGGSSGELEFILWDSAQKAWLDQSADLAGHIQDTAARRGLGSRGVNQAGFYVLTGAYMPAVLVEVGFLSNRREEGRLKDERHLRKVAEAVTEGMVAFFRSRA